MNFRNSPRMLFMIILGIVAFCSSCELIIDVSIPDKERKIVVNGLISPDKPVKMHLSRSLSVLEPDSVIALSAADARLFDGTTMIGKFIEDSSGYYSLPGFIPLSNKSYRLTVSEVSLKPVDATAVLPEPVVLLAVDTVTVTNSWGWQELKLKIRFSDPPGRKNLYGIGVNITTNEIDYRTMQPTGRKVTHPAYLYNTDDHFLQDESHYFDGKIFFDDVLFNGTEKLIEVGVSDYSFFESDTVWMDVRLEQLDESYYRYVVSNEAYGKANGNPFAEPVQVYSNVNGGYGIFAGSTFDVKRIEILGLRKF